MPPLWVGRGSDEPDIAFGLTRAGGASRPALLAPLARVPRERVAIVSTFRPSSVFDWCVDEEPFDATASLETRLASVRVGVSAGQYVIAGAMVDRLVRRVGGVSVTVQHGAVTPDAPPLAEDAKLLAWSAADAAYWTAGRGDVEATVVGSQLLHEAAVSGASSGTGSASRTPAGGGEETPVFLGQLHASEFSRPEALGAAVAFCRATSASYRPHPSEADVASRLAHRYLRMRGVDLERSGRPLSTLDNPVVTVFSTGVLEAAARGGDAWVFHPSPPAWLRAFWERYGMAVWGGDEPTPPPDPVEDDPAGRIAELLVGFADGSTSPG